MTGGSAATADSPEGLAGLVTEVTLGRVVSCWASIGTGRIVPGSLQVAGLAWTSFAAASRTPPRRGTLRRVQGRRMYQIGFSDDPDKRRVDRDERQ